MLSQNPDYQTKKGMFLFEMGDVSAASTLFESVIEKYPDDIGAKLGQSLSQYYLGNPTELFVTIDQLIKGMPDEAQLYIGKGFFLLKMHRNEEALSIFHEAYALTNDSEFQRRIEFYISFASGDHLGALAIYKELEAQTALSNDIREMVVLSMVTVNDQLGLKNLVDKMITGITSDNIWLWLRGCLKFDERDYEGALKDLLSSYEASKDRLNVKHVVKIRVLLGRCYLELKIYSDAIREFSDAISLDDTCGEAYFERGKIKSIQKDYKSAVIDFQMSMKCGYCVEVSLYNIGSCKIKSAMYEEAKIHFQSLLKLYPNDPNGHYGMGVYHTVKTDYVKARKAYEKCLKLDDKYSDSWAALAVLDMLENQIEKAQAKAKKAEELGDKSGQVEYVKGCISFSQMNFAESINWFNLSLEKNPELVNSYGPRGRAKLALNDESGISDLWKSYHSYELLPPEIARNYPNRYYDGGMAALLSKDFKKAEMIFTEGIIQHTKSPELFHGRANARDELKNYPGAIGDLKKVIEISGNTSDLQVFIASMYVEMEKFKEAAEVLDDALSNNDEDTSILMLYGLVEYEWNKRDLGRGHFLKAIQINNGIGKAHYYLGLIAKRKNNRKESISYFENAANLGYEEAAKELLDMVKLDRLASDAKKVRTEDVIQEIIDKKYSDRIKRGETIKGSVKIMLLADLRHKGLEITDNQLRSYLTRLGYTKPREKEIDPVQYKIGRKQND